MRDADETPPQAQEPGELQEQLLDHLEREAGEPSAPNSSQSDAALQRDKPPETHRPGEQNPVPPRMSLGQETESQRRRHLL